MVVGLRVTEEEEREGLDITLHGETAYQQLIDGLRALGRSSARRLLSEAPSPFPCMPQGRVGRPAVLRARCARACDVRRRTPYA